MYSVSDERMVNFNKNNPFVILAKTKHFDMESQFITTTKYIGIQMILSIALVLFSIFAFLFDYVGLENTMIAIYLAIFNVAMWVVFCIKIIANSKIKDINTILDAEVNDILGMNNETLMNLICDIEYLTGAAYSYQVLATLHTIIGVVLLIVTAIIGGMI